MALKTVKKELKSHQEVSHLLLSAAAGGIIGVAAALLLAPKSGGKLRQDIVETYSDISDHITNTKRPSNGKLLLLIGAISGGVLGASAGMLLSSNKKEEGAFTKRLKGIQEAGKCIAESSVDWIDTARDVINTISETVHQGGQQLAEEVEEVEEGIKGKGQLQDVLDWAHLGFQVWQNLSKRRR